MECKKQVNWVKVMQDFVPRQLKPIPTTKLKEKEINKELFLKAVVLIKKRYECFKAR